MNCMVGTVHASSKAVQLAMSCGKQKLQPTLREVCFGECDIQKNTAGSSLRVGAPSICTGCRVHIAHAQRWGFPVQHRLREVSFAGIAIEAKQVESGTAWSGAWP